MGDLEKNTKICRIIFNTIEATAETGGGREGGGGGEGTRMNRRATRIDNGTGTSEACKNCIIRSLTNTSSDLII